MNEAVRDTKVVDEHVAQLDHLPSSDSNAGASDFSKCTKWRAHDSPSLLGCEISKDQDMAALRSGSAPADIVVIKAFQQNVECLESRIQGALKQAVKEILEQLGKEAATRVFMAERKASTVEQEHIYTKQQALAMMLRIKHTSDAQLVDAEKRFLLERQRSQDLDAKVLALQDTIKRLKAELKKKGDTMEEMQRQIQSEIGGKPGLMSPTEGVSKKRKGITQARLTEDECDDTATVLASIVARSRLAEVSLPLLGRSVVHSFPRNALGQECSRATPLTQKQTSPASVRRNLDEGTAARSLGHHVMELSALASIAAEHRTFTGGTKGSRVRAMEVEEDLELSDQHDSSLEGPSQNVDQKSQSRHEKLAHGEDMDGIDDGFLGLIALQDSQPNLGMQELSNGHTDTEMKSGPTPKDENASDSSTDDEEEYQSRQNGAAHGRKTKSNQGIQHKADEGDSTHEAGPSTTIERLPKGSEVEQTKVLRHSPAGKRRGKQKPSTEKPGTGVPKDKEPKVSIDSKVPEIFESGLPNAKGGAVDALEGSSSVMVESSRDSRRLMQGARQLLSLRKL